MNSDSKVNTCIFYEYVSIKSTNLLFWKMGFLLKRTDQTILEAILKYDCVFTLKYGWSYLHSEAIIVYLIFRQTGRLCYNLGSGTELDNYAI